MVEALDDDWWENSVENKQDHNDGSESDPDNEDAIIDDDKGSDNGQNVDDDAPIEAGNQQRKRKKESDEDGDTPTKKTKTGQETANKKKKSKSKEESASIVQNNEQESKSEKKRKRKTITDVLASQVQEGLSHDDLIQAINKKYKDKLTGLEWDEITLEESHFAKCNDLTHTPNSYLKMLVPKWKKVKAGATKQPGSPLILVICSAAIRAANFTRLIADFKGEDCKIMKLFAKHIKLEEQTKQLKKTAFHIGIGTPNRIQALIENESLKLTDLQAIVLDWSWRDCKQKRLMDNPQIRDDLFTLLKQHLIPCVKKQRTRIGLL